MARKRYVCRLDKEGRPRVIPADQVMEHRPGESPQNFEARIRQSLYHLECRDGSRFHIPGYNKNQLKRAWQQAA